MSRELQDHHYVTLKFTTEEPVYFEIGDSVEIPDFGYFELVSAYFPTYNETTGGYDYEMQMDADYMAWQNKILKYRPDYGANETSFKLTSTVAVHLGVILSNIKALGFKHDGKDYSVDYTTYNNNAFDVTKRFYIEYSSTSILEALNTICSEDNLDCEWWVDGSIIYLGYCEMAGQTTFEQGENMASMSQSESESSYITRLYAFGSDRNIPDGYFTGSDADVTTDGVATDYLMLPTQAEDADGFVAKNGYLENTNVVKNDKQAIEGVVMFDDEYPQVSCKVSTISTYDSTVENEDGTKTTQTFWQVTSTDSFATKFEQSWIKSNLNLSIKFTSGALNGMEFEVAFKIKEQVNYFEIVANDTYGRTLPDKALCPKVGDEFFLFNWDASKITETDLIKEAQASLLERAKQYYQKSMIDNSNFTCVLDSEKFYNNGTYDFHPLGEQVKLINPMFSQVDSDGKHYRNSRIIGMEINLDVPYDSPTYTVGEKASSSRLNKLETQVDSITVNGIQIGSASSGGGNGVYVIGVNDNTSATDSNVYSARRTRLEFLSKTQSDTAQGIITFLKGLLIASGYKWDSTGDITARNIIASIIQSSDYDSTAESGYGFTQRKDGKWQLSLTDLTIWGKAIFNQLTIRKLNSVDGNIVFSPSASKLIAVKVTDEGYKCWLLADDGTMATTNSWEVDDQARCETFDVAAGTYEGVSNKSYWRRVTAVSSENEQLTDDNGNILYGGQKFAWIILSKTDCAENSDVPAAGDTIVLEGNRTNTDRQSLAIKETWGDDAPREVGYTGVNSYSLEGKVTYEIGPKAVRFYTQYYEQVTVDGSVVKQIAYRGDYDSTAKYGYYEEVTYNGTRWLCIVPTGQTATEKPSETSDQWRATTAVLIPTLSLYHDLGAGIAIGETHQVVAKAYLGDTDITDKVTAWKVSRNSGDTTEDAAWALKDKVKNFSGTLPIVWSETEDDLGTSESGYTTFTFEATTADGDLLSAELTIT